VPIPEHKIDEVLARVDLVGLVSRHVELKKSGKSFKGRCPFHQEKSASFYVTPEMGRFKCFGCQAGGDAIAFVQRYLGKTFVDAVRDLAREVGVDLEAAEDPGAKERAHLREVTDLAQAHFQGLLWHPTDGRVGREVLAQRGVSEETARAFGLGWAPEAWSRLADALLARGLLEFGIAAGLVQRRPKAEGVYDVFRGRLMIPIRDARGRVIGFGGRILGEGEPKYLNSPETVLFDKGRERLYALDRARDEICRRKAVCWWRLLRRHRAAPGGSGAVALCSPPSPWPPGRPAAGRGRELVLLPRGDAAGRAAVERAGPGAARRRCLGSRWPLLPEGEDPDTFARSRRRRAQGWTGRCPPNTVPDAVLGGAGGTFERKMEALGRLRPVVAELPVGLLRSAFFPGWRPTRGFRPPSSRRGYGRPGAEAAARRPQQTDDP
jgi:DNA primase